MIVVAADVGGTNARLALVEVQGAQMRFFEERTYASAAFGGLEQILERFVAEAGTRVERACVAIAGPVHEDHCATTNLPWTVDARALQRASGIARVKLVNDFHGAAAGVLELDHDGAVHLLGPARSHRALGGSLAVLGAGTGLGEAILARDGDRFVIVPTEGGHTDFAPRRIAEVHLLSWLTARHSGHVSYERVASGPGLVSLYEFLVEAEGRPPAALVESARAAAADVAAAISTAAEAGDATSGEALDWMLDVLLAEAGNLALKSLATGGVFVCGGIAPRVLPRLRAVATRGAFTDKGRYRELLDAVPMWVVTDTRLGLRGAARIAVGLG